MASLESRIERLEARLIDTDRPLADLTDEELETSIAILQSVIAGASLGSFDTEGVALIHSLAARIGDHHHV